MPENLVAVRIMRSHEFCQFEVMLASPEVMSMDQVNALRQRAAMLVDEAVRQYDAARAHDRKRGSLASERYFEEQRIADLKRKGPDTLTVREAADVRAAEDAAYWGRYRDAPYDYESDDRGPWREKLEVRVDTPAEPSPVEEFIAAFDTWAVDETDPGLCAGPLFDAMVAAREKVLQFPQR